MSRNCDEFSPLPTEWFSFESQKRPRGSHGLLLPNIRESGATAEIRHRSERHSHTYYSCAADGIPTVVPGPKKSPGAPAGTSNWFGLLIGRVSVQDGFTQKAVAFATSFTGVGSAENIRHIIRAWVVAVKQIEEFSKRRYRPLLVKYEWGSHANPFASMACREIGRGLSARR